jgi:hypothetical protein
VKLVPLVAVPALLLPATAAQAVPTASLDGDTVTVAAPPGEANQIHPKPSPCFDCAPGVYRYLLQDKSFVLTNPEQNMIAGPGCTANTGDGGAFCGDTASVRVLRLTLDDGDDRANRPDLSPTFGSPPITADYDGGPGDDRLRGGDQADTLDGGTRDDFISGEGGNDVLIGGPGADLLFAGDGNDVVRAADGTRDKVNCGPGRDRAIVDRRDDVARTCERVRVTR